MKNNWLRVKKLWQPATYAISMLVGVEHCRWVFGEVSKSTSLHFKTILASGAISREQPWVSEGGLIKSEDLKQALQMVIRNIGNNLPKPSAVVLAVPAGQAFLGELTVSAQDNDEMIRFDIDELLQAAAGDVEREMAYDWQAKGGVVLADDSRHLAVAAIDIEQINEITQACKALKLDCLGVTLDSIAALNGYIQASKGGLKKGAIRFLLHGDLSKNKVRLAVFSHGMLLHESVEHSDNGFSVVQAISALERLVSTYGREGFEEQEGSVRLILGGELMHANSTETTAKRSQLLSGRIYEVTPRKELAKNWHYDVTPYGALEGMPCE